MGPIFTCNAPSRFPPDPDGHSIHSEPINRSDITSPSAQVYYRCSPDQQTAPPDTEASVCGSIVPGIVSLLPYVVHHGEDPPQDLTCTPFCGDCPLRRILSPLTVPHIPLDSCPGIAAHTSTHNCCAAVPRHRVNLNVAFKYFLSLLFVLPSGKTSCLPSVRQAWVLHLRTLLSVFRLHLFHPPFVSLCTLFLRLTHILLASSHSPPLRLTHPPFVSHPFCVLHTFSLRFYANSSCGNPRAVLPTLSFLVL